MKRKVITGIVAGIALLSAVIIFIIVSVEPPPVKEVSEAGINLANAEKESLPQESREIYLTACLYYDSAMSSWKDENNRFIISRKFNQVKYYAETSSKLALESVRMAKTENHDLAAGLKEGISRASRLVEKYSFICSSIPMNASLQKDYALGKISLQEAVIALKNSNFETARNKLDTANELINKCLNHTLNTIEEYFKSLEKWKELAEKAVKKSKSANTTCIIIDKFARTCQLYKRGVMTGQYNVELSRNWMGDKNYRGDKSTPEGQYKITRKKSRGETKYYKALLLNYPNEDDKKRFEAARKNGQISRDANIGSLIEIHGNGGQGADWTDGCVALKNDDMDKIFAACSVGTEVIIVGSLKPLKELLN